MTKDKKILFAVPYHKLSYSVIPPISLGYLASSLSRSGWNNVEIMNCILNQMDSKQFEKEIARKKPDVLGMSVYSSNLPMVKDYLETAKRANPNIINIVGGPHPSSVPGKELFGFFGKSIDFAFIAEADKGLPILLDKLFGYNNVSFEDIPGLIWKDGDIIKANERYLESNLDSLPMPRWDLIPPDKYPRAPAAGFFKNFPIAPLVTSRGCPFECTFCASKPLVGRNIRFRSIENVVEEIRYVHEKYGVKEFHILDDNFTLNRERAYGICKKIIEDKIPVSFFGVSGFRLDTLDEELLAIMKKAGFFAINVGVESGSQRILDHMKKNLKKDLIREKVALISKMGFRVGGFFIIGYPTSTREEIEETIKFAKSLKLDRATFSSYSPLPGSEMYQILKSNNELQGLDWSKIAFALVTYVPKGMTAEELKGLQRKAFRSFFLRPKIIYNLLRDLRSPQHFKFVFKRASAYLLPKKR